MELNNASELCTRCGLCCVGLRAWSTVDDAEETCRQMNVDLSTFINIDERDEDGKALMKFPCTFLRGSVLHYVSCAAYKVPRPKVCHAYYCKVAVRYRLKQITLDQGMALLRRGFWLNDVAAYNWTPQPEDTELTRVHQAAVMGCSLEKDGVQRDVVNYLMMTTMVPNYGPGDDIDANLLSMHFYTYDIRDRIEPRKRLTFYMGEAVDAMSDADVKISLRAVDAVFDTLRELVKTSEDAEPEIK